MEACMRQADTCLPPPVDGGLLAQLVPCKAQLNKNLFKSKKSAGLSHWDEVAHVFQIPAGNSAADSSIFRFSLGLSGSVSAGHAAELTEQVVERGAARRNHSLAMQQRRPRAWQPCGGGGSASLAGGGCS